MDRFRRASAAALLTAVTLAGAMGGAAASSGVPAPPSGERAQDLATRPALSAYATARSVAAWEEFRIHGAARNVDSGTPVSLQQKQGKRWVTLPATIRTARSGEYSMRVKLGITGENALRIVGGGAVSPVVRTTVTSAVPPGAPTSVN
ncbi:MULTISPECIES: hypothetical protein [Streptomyces]|uniref:Secreted protein n=1 Tax=Streptomyces glycanivorans TaxID=3033808 RepID=A0ABY9JL28_9ACTN|nr:MULTISPECIES: hypothetical protein [unclassified Streptomyces]WSQ81795.1 hypothetical protein OG725_33905 [Streptomyces sp. NBC_01213]TXS15895.1 hypothetical protein EAO68_16270 [Streptomyces sp. wa22]WLQ68435.1 hypothetical protein P8A20_34905 [Streptomyces sp. Alt3]WSR04873.1 hypothetical protein OG265_02195 [Streptomyces sp. NBC_01208]WSR52516.1 hypothetical protein OG279_34900 [Streptomyces sp. NBC_01201]